MAQQASDSEPPLVSLLVPAYNHERYVTECLDSIRDEGWPRLELIVVDDASPDGTLGRIESWIAENGSSFERVVAVSHGSNAGVIESLNELVSLASGAFLVPLASDDRLVPGGIAARLDAFDAGAVAVMGDAQVIDTDGIVTHGSAARDLHGADAVAMRDTWARGPELILRWSAPGPVLMFDRQRLLEARGPRPYQASGRTEDRELYLALIARRGLRYVHAPVAQYRIHSHNTSGRDRDAALAVTRDIAATEAQSLEAFRGFDRALVRLAATRSHASVARLEARRRFTVRSGVLYLGVQALLTSVRLAARCRRALHLFPDHGVRHASP